MLPIGTSNQLQYACDDENRHFRTDHLKDDLAGRSARGGAVTLSAQVLKFVISTAATIVLARMLTPQDYGLIGMVTGVTGFVAMFKDAGLSMATIQRERITEAQVSTLFWLNVALSTLLMLMVMALAPGLATFYREPRLLWPTMALAITFIMGGRDSRVQQRQALR